MTIETQRLILNLAERLERLEKPDTGGVVTAYTPTYFGISTAGVTTYTTQLGFYVRIGPLVIATGIVVWTAATGTGTAAIGLPFTAANTTGKFYACSLRTSGVTFAAGAPQGFINPNTAYIELNYPTSNAAATGIAVEAAGSLIFTAVFFVE